MAPTTQLVLRIEVGTMPTWCEDHLSGLRVGRSGLLEGADVDGRRVTVRVESAGQDGTPACGTARADWGS